MLSGSDSGSRRLQYIAPYGVILPTDVLTLLHIRADLQLLSNLFDRSKFLRFRSNLSEVGPSTLSPTPRDASPSVQR